MSLAGRQITLGPVAAPVQVAPTEPWQEGVAQVLTLQELADGSFFDLERSLAEGYLNVWGASAYNQFEMTPQGSYEMDGGVLSAILGVDHQGVNHVAGLAVAFHGGSGTFAGLGAYSASGDVGTSLFSVHPYVRVTFADMFHVGGSAGFGLGGMSIDQDQGSVVETGASMPIMAAADLRVDLIPVEAWLLAIQADGYVVRMASAEADELPAVEAGTARLRFGLENSFAFLVADGVSVAPVLETAVRHDDGDAETGFGLDLGGGVRVDATTMGLMVEATGHVSFGNAPEEDADDEAPATRNWGVAGVVRWRPDGGDTGPQVSVAPSWGGTPSSGAAASLNAEVGYGLTVFGSGVLTPYGAAGFSGDAQGTYRVGARLQFDPGMQLSAEGTHEQSAAGSADQFFTVRLRLLQ